MSSSSPPTRRGRFFDSPGPAWHRPLLVEVLALSRRRLSPRWLAHRPVVRAVARAASWALALVVGVGVTHTPARAAGPVDGPGDVFDAGTARVRVFCDDDGDGRVDDGERGAWGARVFVDTGAWAAADATGKLHFAGLPSGMHLARLDERTLPGMTTSSPRQLFYVSPGLPVDVAFALRCATLQRGVDASDPAALIVAADAWRPAAAADGGSVAVQGTLAAPDDDAPDAVALGVDGATIALPHAALTLEPVDGSPAAEAPVLSAPDAGLVLRLRAGHDGGAAALGWHVVLEDVGDAADPRPVWVFAGRGPPPPRVVWGGRADDRPAAPAVLARGGAYRATLTVTYAGGDRATAAPRSFTVRGRGAPALTTAPLRAVPTARVDGVAVDVSPEGRFGVAVPRAPRAALVVEWTRADGGGGRVLVAPASSSSSSSSSPAQSSSSSSPVALRVDPARRTLGVEDVESGALALLGVRVAPTLEQGNVVVELPPGVAVRRTTVQAFVGDAATPWRELVVSGPATRVPLGAPLPPGAPVRLRVTIVDADGNRGLGPDVIVGEAPPVAGGGVDGAALVLPDPFGRGGRTRPKAAVTAALAAFAAGLSPSATVRVEVHSDDRGPRLRRRTSSQAQAEALRRALVAAGVAPERVVAVGRGSDAPLVPNLGPRARRANRRAMLYVDDPRGGGSGDGSAGAAAGAAVVLVNGAPLPAAGRAFAGTVAPLADGEVVVVVKDAAGARAVVTVRRPGAVWQGTPGAYRALVAAVSPPPPPGDDAAPTNMTNMTDMTDATGSTGSPGSPGSPGAAVGATDATDATDATGDGDAVVDDDHHPAPHEGGPPPPWWPMRAAVPAARLTVTLPATHGPLRHDVLPVRGRADPASRVTVNGVAVDVDPVTGEFAAPVTLPEGRSSLVVEAEDALGDRARVAHPVDVDTTGWFFLALSDAAVGGDGALLPERAPTTAVTMGDIFAYGRAAAWAKGRFHGQLLFSDYDLSLHLDTRRFVDDAFFPDVLDPDRGFAAWGDASLERLEARSAWPLFVDLAADDSRLTVGAVRTALQAGQLLRYRRARPGAQLVFDRGWLDPVVVAARAPGPRPAPADDPWRTRAEAFAHDGGGARHARVELQGTGGSLYLLRHAPVVAGSEQVSVIVRDAITGSELSRTPLLRNVDYNVRYDAGRVVLKAPLSTFAATAAVVNHNLGQVTAAHRLFLEVDYEH
ncbi:MAG: hypothetical protein FJ137_21595, partial [Deltaproteobacteria bacterium]|nr:hypothetical protein [Deltaproteobacteria bacterium]